MAMFLDGQRMTVDGAITGLPRKPMMDVNIQANALSLLKWRIFILLCVPITPKA
jgi:hypothetical protein